jgi:hypothetical protein
VKKHTADFELVCHSRFNKAFGTKGASLKQFVFGVRQLFSRQLVVESLPTALGSILPHSSLSRPYEEPSL